MCICHFIKGNGAVEFEEKYLHVMKVDAYKWKTIYQCNECNIYWEETFADDRFGGIPELRKVNISYVHATWNLELSILP